LATKHETQARLARSLGWFSIGLGLAEVAAPRTLSRVLGVDEHPTLMRACGVREIASGVGILASRRPAPWLWARVGGDVMDLTLLAAGLPNAPGRVAGAMAAVAGVTALDVVASQAVSRNGIRVTGTTRVKRSIIVNRSPEELYRFWRHFENLPRVMSSLESVRVLDGRRSHWVAKGPAGTHVEWDAEIAGDNPNSYIAWRSLPGSAIETSGSVRFAPAAGGRGTLVEVEMYYVPLAGALGATVATLFGREPGREIAEALRRFKWLMETGEIPTTSGQPAGRSLSRAVLSRMTRLGGT
jgi:uncharacterized membrane protein